MGGGNIRIAENIGDPVRLKALELAAAGGVHASAHLRARFALFVGGHLRIAYGGHLYLYVYSVGKRSAYLGKIFLYLVASAIAGLGRMPEKAAFARVHRANEHKAAGIAYAPLHARDRYLAVLKRLTQRLHTVFREFGKFVKEQHAVVRKRYLARLRYRASAHKRGGGHSVMRCAERTCLYQSFVFARQPRNGVYLGGLKALLVGKVG